MCAHDLCAHQIYKNLCLNWVHCEINMWTYNTKEKTIQYSPYLKKISYIVMNKLKLLENSWTIFVNKLLYMLFSLKKQ